MEKLTLKLNLKPKWPMRQQRSYILRKLKEKIFN